MRGEQFVVAARIRHSATNNDPESRPQRVEEVVDGNRLADRSARLHKDIKNRDRRPNALLLRSPLKMGEYHARLASDSAQELPRAPRGIFVPVALNESLAEQQAGLVLSELAQR